jgi:hypothetical protein
MNAVPIICRSNIIVCSENLNKLLFMAKLPASFLTIVLIYFVCSSCSIIRVVEVPSWTSDCAGSGQHFCHDTIIHSSIWKSKNKMNLKSTCSTGISRVKVTTRPMDVILGFITAGIVVKQRIEWDCAQRTGAGEIP